MLAVGVHREDPSCVFLTNQKIETAGKCRAFSDVNGMLDIMDFIYFTNVVGPVKGRVVDNADVTRRDILQKTGKKHFERSNRFIRRDKDKYIGRPVGGVDYS